MASQMLKILERIFERFDFKGTDKGWPPFVRVSDIDRVHCYLCSQTLLLHVYLCSQTLLLNMENNRNDEEYHDLYL